MQQVVVFGATGRQGGSVVSHLLASGSYKIRAVTRDVYSEKAQNLAKKGVEVVKGDLLQPRQTLIPLLKDAYAVFGVTDYWSLLSRPEGAEKMEVQCGKNLVDAIVEAGVPFPIFSGLPSAFRLTGNKIRVSHFESKAAIEEYIEKKGHPFIVTHPYAYFENLFYWLQPSSQVPGSFEIVLPMDSSNIFLTCMQDFGGVIASILKSPQDYLRRRLDVVHLCMDFHKIAEVLSEVFGKKVVYRSVSVEEYKRLPFPGASDLADMFAAYQIMFDKNHIQQFDMNTARELYPQCHSLASWANEHKAELLKLH
ncbi:NmrA-like family domain-containing protein 1 [Galdieria sulphuraria]|uniref:NmrA-like family domain-containing protein 1 n=1 Tax=Galdieria sulphuraria TaxID=130081 RepID=M2XDL9_GALSU|nr:NmrA-like family domain-containing protein 1 [Galdieria sulphuraria]EME28087.1 NmrA-like family domain-containing protein 1 [Galdieria sulphuraria]GJD12123.1 NmrA-like family domain-containing protein 1 [Galdieria sulphuraria]|eukprot:XP_005704607.1 NmrA-like family domain-containing protein 1 [Galdieria sulphuraria]